MFFAIAATHFNSKLHWYG